MHVAVQDHPRREKRKALRRCRGDALFPGVDDHAVDLAFEHRAGRRPRDRIRQGQVPQPLHRRAADGHPRQRPRRIVLHQEDGGDLPDHGRKLDGARTGGHPLRAADPLGKADGRRVPRDHRRLCDYVGRYGHRAHRTDVRRRRRPRGTHRGHRPPVHGRQGRQKPADGRQTGQVLQARRPRPGIRRAERRRRKIQGVCGPLRQERLRPGDRLRCRDNARHRPGRDAESPEQGIQDRKAYPLLPPLLAYGQAGALLPARFVVHPHHGAARADDRAEQDDPMETRIDRDRPFRQMARRAGGLEPFALALLGHSAAGMGYGGLLGTEVHRFDRGADGRDRKVDRRGLHEGEPLQELQGRRHVEGELLDPQYRPAPSLCGQYRTRVVERRADEARKRPDRRVVRLGCHAVRAAALSVRERRRVFQVGLPGRFHRRGRRPDARLVLHAACHRLDALRLGSLQEHHFERAGVGQERQQDVEAPGQRRRPVRGTRNLRGRRHALVHDLQLAAVGQPQVRQGRRGRSTPQVLRDAL